MARIRKDIPGGKEVQPGSGGGGEDVAGKISGKVNKGAQPHRGKAPLQFKDIDPWSPLDFGDRVLVADIESNGHGHGNGNGEVAVEDPTWSVEGQAGTMGTELVETGEANGGETAQEEFVVSQLRRAAAERTQRFERYKTRQDQRDLAAAQTKLETVEFGEKPETTEEKLRYVADFLGLKLAGAMEITPAVEAKIEQVYGLVEATKRNAELREQVRVFADVFDTTVETTQEIIDGTSHWTGEHSKRLTLLGYALAKKQWPFSSEYLQGLVQAGYLHDVGKILLPKDILDKDGALTDAEFLTMTGHASRGYELLMALRRHRRWITDGTFHHENYDGKGYGHGHKFDAGKRRDDREPWGLKGAEIPPIARTLQVADVIDALLDFRPYKNGWTMERVIQMMEKQAGTEFDPLIIAQLVDLYESREFTAESYFHMEEQKQEIHDKFKEEFEYSADRNRATLEANRNQILGLLVPAQRRGRSVFDAKDFVRLLGSTDVEALTRQVEGLQGLNGELEIQTAKGRDLYIDALFLMLKSVDARYEACWGQNAETIGGQDRIENTIRYAVMLGQRYLDYEGITDPQERVEFLGRVSFASMFPDVGMTQLSAETIGRRGVLGVTGYKEMKTMPRKGQELLNGFLTGDAKEYFRDADTGAREANLWANGEAGYGVSTERDGKPSLIGRIVGIAYKYTALRSKTAYRADGMTHYEAMEAMRKNVGTEFDEELWRLWEELGSLDVLRGFNRRPEVIDQVKQLLGGAEPVMVSQDAKAQRLLQETGLVLDEKDLAKQIQMCLAEAELANDMSRFNAVERIIELLESKIVQTHDTAAVERIRGLYVHDLDKDKLGTQGLVDERLKSAVEQDHDIKYVFRALAAVAQLVSNYAEAGAVLEPELIESFREKILPVYRLCADKLLLKYASELESEKYDDADATWRILEQKVFVDLGDSEFEEQARAVRQQAEQKRKEAEVLAYIREEISEDVDPWNGEHYIALAHKLMSELAESGIEISATAKETLATAEKNFYQKNYPAMFEQAQAMAEAGSVQVTEALLKKAREWAELAGGELPEDWVHETMLTAYRQGIEKMHQYLAAADLGLEDAPKIGRWLTNLESWSKKADIDITPARLVELRQYALSTLQGNLPMEVQRLGESDEASIVDVKRFWVTFDEYIRKSDLATEVVDENVETAIGGLGEVLWNKFIEQELSKKAEEGDPYRTDLAVKNFRKFCVDKDRNGEVIVRWEITDEQEAVMADLRGVARQRALENRLHNIQIATKELSAASSATPEDRIGVELEDWHTIASELTDMGWQVEEDKLDVSVYGVVEERIMTAVINDQPAVASLALRKLASWVDGGMVAQLDGDLQFIRGSIEPRLDGWFKVLAERGDLREFKALSEAVGRWYGDDILPSNYMDLHSVCAESYLNRVSVQAELYAIKSWLEPLRELQHEVTTILDTDNSSVGTVHARLNVLAAGIYSVYANVGNSMVAVGSLMHRWLESQRGAWADVRDSLAAMEDNQKAQQDAELLGGLLKLK